MPELTDQEHVERIKSHAAELANALRAASDAGVSHSIILPQLMLIFRSSFGEPPAGLLASIQGLPK